MSLENSEIEKLKKKYLRPPNQMGLARLKTFVLENSPAWLVVALMRRFITKSDYQSKRESVAFFRRANMAYGAHRQRRSVRLLRVAFGLLGAELSKDYSRLIIGATNQTQRDASRRSALSGEILEATKALPIGRTDATGWYQLSRGLFSVGYFRAAWVARENSIELSILEGGAVGAGVNAVGRAVQALLERRNFADVEALLAKATGQINETGLRNVRAYLNMMQNKYVMPPLDSNSPSFNAEKLFSELITGKSVALVGTGSPSGRYGNAIDSADTVVRIKYVGCEHLPPQEFHGLRCDSSVLPDLEQLAILDRNGLTPNFLNELKILVSMKPSPSRMIGFKQVKQFEVAANLYRTTAVSGLKTLFETLSYKPHMITLYGFDFYTKREQYDVSLFGTDVITALLLDDNAVFNFFYTRHEGVQEWEILMSFLIHDPVSNFCFAQNLYKAGLFEIEPYGASILALTPYQYVERLEEMLGDW